MNDYEMMNHRVNQLRIQLADVAKEQLILDRSKEAIMAELIDIRRQITRVDKQDQAMNLRIPEVHPLASVDYLDV